MDDIEKKKYSKFDDKDTSRVLDELTNIILEKEDKKNMN